MLNKDLGNWPLGPNGAYGSVDLAMVEGQLQASVKLSPKAALDAIAKDINNPAAASVAAFLEAAVGLA